MPTIILTFPMASKPLSNRNSTPRNRKPMPIPDKPIPISKNKLITTYKQFFCRGFNIAKCL